MKYLDLIRAAAALAALAAGTAFAQAPSVVISDVAPLPAEDRSSVGAVVLEASPVLALKTSTTITTQTMGAGPSSAEVRAAANARAKAEKRARKQQR